MDANAYQSAALRTWAPATTEPNGQRIDLLYHAAQLGAEAGEVAGKITKWAKYGAEFDAQAAADELGDLQWHLAVLADILGYDLGDIMAANLGKLAIRHPTGNPAIWYQRQDREAAATTSPRTGDPFRGETNTAATWAEAHS